MVAALRQSGGFLIVGVRASSGIRRLLFALAATVVVVQFGLPALAVQVENAERGSLATSPPEGVVEDYDYSFIGEVLGRPVRWSCGTPIGVSLHGPVPYGAGTALESAVSLIVEASGLPLRVSDSNIPTADITVDYSDAATSADLAEDDLGVAATGWESSTGRITSASVIIRADSAAGDPSSHVGNQVLLHELAHAVGLDHAVQGSGEIMQPMYDPALPIGFGPGDNWALRVVGCS